MGLIGSTNLQIDSVRLNPKKDRIKKLFTLSLLQLCVVAVWRESVLAFYKVNSVVTEVGRSERLSEQGYIISAEALAKF